MNKKQLVSMWCGIVVFVLHSYNSVICLGQSSPSLKVDTFLGFIMGTLVIIAVTGGFIVTFKSKKR